MNVTVGPAATFSKGSKWNFSMQATTDADGNFKMGEVANPRRDTYLVIISKAGYLGASSEFISPSGKKYVSSTDNGFTHNISAILVREQPSH